MFLATADGSTYDADPNSLNDLGLYMEDLPYCSAALDDAGKALSDWTLTLLLPDAEDREAGRHADQRRS